MNKKIVISFLAVAAVMFPAAGQSSLEELLVSIEQNNLTLGAEVHNVEGRTYEARTGNSLEPLGISYESVWDSPQAAGKSGEMEVSQTFDLPMLYVTRSRIAKSLASQYNAEYLALRQEILLEAKQIYLELCTLGEVYELMEARLDAAGHVSRLFASRYEKGDATLIDRNRTEFEYLLLRESISETGLRMIELIQRLTVLNGGIPVALQFAMPAVEPLAPMDVLLSDWEEYAPDMTIARLGQQVARQETRLSRQQALPKVEIGYRHEYATGEAFNGITAGLSIPIFSNRFNVKRARAFEEAARINAESVLVEKRNAVTETYQKVQYIGELRDSFGIMPDASEYIEMLGRLLEAGEMNIVDYYSELDTFYTTIETRYKVELEYRKGLAALNVIYM